MGILSLLLETNKRKKEEDRLSYFRDDYGLNAQHTNFHWVLFHRGIPSDPLLPRGARRLTLPDHQGELQLFMHQQLLQRYRYERAALGMPPPTPYGHDLSEVLDEYHPSPLLTTPTDDWPWPYLPRPRGPLTNRLEPLGKGLDDLQRWWGNLKRVIALGYIPEDNGTGIVPMDEEVEWKMHELSEGSPRGRLPLHRTPLTRHLLGSLMENSLAAEPWPSYFGFSAEGYHNSIHDLLSVVGQRRSNSTGYGVLGSLQDSLRDPVFYRLHEHIDELRRAYVRSLAPNNLAEHAPDCVRVTAFSAETPSLCLGPNVLHTRLEPGSELYERGRLDHDPFQWRLTLRCLVEEGKSWPLRVTVRVFYCAESLALQGDCDSFIEMDKFAVQLPAPTPREATEVQVEVVRPAAHSSVAVDEDRSHFTAANLPRACGCGTPRNLLLPRGRREGLRGLMVAVLTSGNDVDEEALGPGKTWEVGGAKEGQQTLRAAGPIRELEFCASTAKGKVPDRLEMGYPFSRSIALPHGCSLLETLQAAKNCVVTEVLVFHSSQGNDPWENAREDIVDTRVSKGNPADVHVYFDPGRAESVETALELRGKMQAAFPLLRYFKVHHNPIGPHPTGMWEADFRNVPTNQLAATYGSVVGWLALNRKGLSVLIHPHTGNELLDHLQYGVWLGEPLELDRSRLFGEIATPHDFSNFPIFLY